MATSLGSLVVSLGLDAAEYTRGLDKAERAAQRATARINQALSQVDSGLRLGAAAVAGGVALLIKSSIDAADHLNDLSKAANVSVESIGGIGFAAGQAGSDLDSVAGSLGKLNLKIAEAARGDKDAAALFKAVGVSALDASGNARKADEVFADLADRFASYEDGPKKAALGNAIFGKSYQSVLPLLNEGGQALRDNIAYYQRFGGTTTETAAAADKFNDTLAKISFVSGQVGRSIGSEALPPLQVLADQILRAAENSDAFRIASAGVRIAIETLAVLGANVAFVFTQIGDGIGAAAAAANALVRGDLQGVGAIYEERKRTLREAREELDKFEQSVLNAERRGGDLGQTDRRELARRGRPSQPFGRSEAPDIPGTAPAGAGRAAKETLTDAEHYLATLQRQVDKTLELSAVDQALLDIRRGIKGLNASLAGEILDKAQQIDASKRLQSQLQAEAQQLKDLEAEQRRIREEGARVYEATRTPVEQLQAEIERLGALLQQGAVDWDTYARAVGRAQDKFDDASGAKKAREDMQREQQRLEADIKGFIGDNLVDLADGNFKSIADRFSRMLTRMAADAAAAEIYKFLFPSGVSVPAGGGGSSGGGIVDALFGAAKSLFGGFFADGGYVPPGKWGILGERGPEPVYGGRTGVTVRPAQTSAPVSHVFSPTFVLQGPVDRRTQEQVAAASFRGALKAQRRGTA